MFVVCGWISQRLKKKQLVSPVLQLQHYVVYKFEQNPKSQHESIKEKSPLTLGAHNSAKLQRLSNNRNTLQIVRSHQIFQDVLNLLTIILQ